MIWYQIENTLQHCWSISVNYDAQMPINSSSVCFSSFNVQLSMHWALICGNSFRLDALLGVLYAMRHLVKNGHQKHIMCYNEIWVCAQIIGVGLVGSTLKTIWKSMWSYVEKESIVNSSLWFLVNFYISTTTQKLEITMFWICKC